MVTAMDEPTAALSMDALRKRAGRVPDPEIPVVSIADLGILRDVRRAADGAVEVVITPTYSGCPAMGQIEDDVRAALADGGAHVRVVTQLAPAWTTDWITAGARARLAAYGIAPPRGPAPGDETHMPQVVRLHARRSTTPRIACPLCGSYETTETSAFGSTACKALYRCLACLEPFDYFKPY